MKMLILAAMAATFLFSMSVAAQTDETVSVVVGHNKAAGRGHLKIRFAAVIQDSRCPTGANCIWAGNATVKIAVTGRRSTKTFELNTTQGDKLATLDGWTITLEGLTPAPAVDATLDPKTYKATFSISKAKS